MARPTVMTKETVNKLEHAFSIGCTDLEACLHADISKQTLYNYQDKHPEFVDRKEMLKQKVVLKAKVNLNEALDKKCYDATKLVLERKAPDYKPASKQEHSGNVTLDAATALIEAIRGRKAERGIKE